MPKRYTPQFTYDHITSVWKALDKQNIPNGVKSVIFKHYKKSFRYKPKTMYREPTIYELVMKLRAERRDAQRAANAHLPPGWSSLGLY